MQDIICVEKRFVQVLLEDIIRIIMPAGECGGLSYEFLLVHDNGWKYEGVIEVLSGNGRSFN
jgi:hypothetical protein